MRLSIDMTSSLAFFELVPEVNLPKTLFSVTYRFVIYAMLAFISSEFHAICSSKRVTHVLAVTSSLEILPEVNQPKKFLSHTIS